MRPLRRSALAFSCVAALSSAACRHATSDMIPTPESVQAVPASALASNGAPGGAPPPLIPGRDGSVIREMLGGGVAQQFPLDRVEEDRKRFPTGAAAIADAADFLFVLGQGSGWHGFDTLRVEASGEAVLVFGGQTGSPWRRATFRLSREELAGLKGELAAIDVFKLKRSYAARVDDGTQWFVRVRAGGQRKSVALDNHFPDPIQRLAEHVRTLIVAPHAAEIDKAPTLASHEKLAEPMYWPEDSPEGRGPQ